MGWTIKLLLPVVFLLESFAAAADLQPTIAVHGPTVVAFFAPVSDKELKAHPDINESLSDFQFYAGGARKAFQNSNIEFHVIYAKSFKIRVGTRTTTFRVGKSGVGYYFVTPGKKPRVEYGVMTDSDMVEIAKQYFGKTGK